MTSIQFMAAIENGSLVMCSHIIYPQDVADIKALTKVSVSSEFTNAWEGCAK